MSSYLKITKHPETGIWQEAQWIDDYFGHYNYGVRFRDHNVYDERDYKLLSMSDNDHACSSVKEPLLPFPWDDAEPDKDIKRTTHNDPPWRMYNK